jgi:hypothetical protein
MKECNLRKENRVDPMKPIGCYTITEINEDIILKLSL